MTVHDKDNGWSEGGKNDEQQQSHVPAESLEEILRRRSGHLQRMDQGPRAPIRNPTIRNPQSPAPIHLGGPVFEKYKDPQGWVAALKKLGYSAAYCPVGAKASDAEVKAYEDAAQKAGIIIAETGAWSNPISPKDDGAQGRSGEVPASNWPWRTASAPAAASTSPARAASSGTAPRPRTSPRRPST